MKIIYKVKIHPLFYITTLIMMITGQFKNFFLFLIIILFHELGHIIVASIYKWKIKQINILPFGAITVFDVGLNVPLLQDLLVAISGSLFQIIIYNALKIKYDIDFIHYSLLIFNLLPIVPLDGSKILCVILNFLFPFKKSNFLLIFLSFIWISILFSVIIYNQFNLVFLLVVLFLIIKNIDEIKNKNYIIYKFFYEKYISTRRYKRLKVIRGNNVNRIYRDCNHIFKVNNKCYTEHEILRKRFDFQSKL